MPFITGCIFTFRAPAKGNSSASDSGESLLVLVMCAQSRDGGTEMGVFEPREESNDEFVTFCPQYFQHYLPFCRN